MQQVVFATGMAPKSNYTRVPWESQESGELSRLYMPGHGGYFHPGQRTGNPLVVSRMATYNALSLCVLRVAVGH
jgi:hypothetical protein